ncbi:hypothetical protein ABT072_45905 [Streptomyces sp. NPDC002589]|uniref:hypothetical protein n=1 Tax=Streptomyces sp. NPDC002589 TaxID=3154420 RepID=UPI00332870DF
MPTHTATPSCSVSLFDERVLADRHNAAGSYSCVPVAVGVAPYDKTSTVSSKAARRLS